MMTRTLIREIPGLVVAWAVLLVGVVGCSGDDEPEVTIDATPYVLSQAPGSVEELKAVYEGIEDDQAVDVVVVGKIGGRLNPWVEGRASFNIVDRSVKSCSDIPGDKCPTPWDYCCTTDGLPGATALVKVVDGNGKALAEDTRRLFQMKELQEVIIKGKATKDENGNLLIVASGLYVKR